MLTTPLLLSALCLQGTPASSKVIPELRARLDVASPAETFPVYAALHERLTFEEAASAARGLPRGARQEAVERALRAYADARQGAVLALLGELEAAGEASDVRQLWIANSVRFEATEQAIARVAALPEVAYIGWTPERDLSELQDAPCSPPPAPAPVPVGGPAPQPNLVQLQAPALWGLGFNGAGTVLLNLDDGVDLDHPDLVNRIWDNPLEALDGVDNDGNGYVDDLHGWDFISNDNNPDGGSHGTNTSGIMVGDGSGGVFLTGMAPGAALVAGMISGEADQWEGLQYGISVGVDAVSSSFSFKWYFSPKPDYHMHRSVSEMVLAAGIIHANSISNDGGGTFAPIPFNISAPGLVPGPWKHPSQTQDQGKLGAVLGCGGIELNDTLYVFSAQGPSAWENLTLYDAGYPHTQLASYWDYAYGGFGGGQQGLIKPDVVTYTNVATTSYGGGYLSTFGGTSAATPHLGGAFCLLVDVQPEAEPRHISQALQRSAKDLGAPGKDTSYGAGKIQMIKAAQRLLHLLKVQDQQVGLGDAQHIDLIGEGSDFYAALWSPALGTTPVGLGTLDLGTPYYVLKVAQLSGGLGAIDFTVPNQTNLIGLSIHLQSVEDNLAGTWGAYLFSVVDSFRITP